MGEAMDAAALGRGLVDEPRRLAADHAIGHRHARGQRQLLQAALVIGLAVGVAVMGFRGKLEAAMAFIRHDLDQGDDFIP